MKHVFNSFTITLAMLCIPVLANAQDKAPELRDQHLQFELKTATPDEEMLEVARAANVNVFMDATEVMEKPSLAVTRASEHTNWQLEHLLSNLTVSRRLVWKFDPENRAFWVSAEPDIKPLRQQLLQGTSIEIAQPKMDKSAFTTRLIDYLQREQGLKNETEPWSRTLNIADLPADLKYDMLVRTQQGLLNQAMGGVSMLRNFLSEKTWNRARIALSPTGNILSLILPTEHSTITHQLMPASQISEAPQ